MFILDRLLVGGLTFVLDKISVAVDQELTSDTALKEQLLDAQMQLELGEIDEAQFQQVERRVIERLRELHAEREAEAGETGRLRVSGVEAHLGEE